MIWHNNSNDLTMFIRENSTHSCDFVDSFALHKAKFEHELIFIIKSSLLIVESSVLNKLKSISIRLYNIELMLDDYMVNFIEAYNNPWYIFCTE